MNPISPLILAIALALSTHAHAVNKCTGPDGKVAFQDAPCSRAGEAISIKPASGNDPVAPPAPKTAASPSVAQPAPVPAVTQAAAPAAPFRSQLDVDSDTCLAWYKPLLRDPKGAYYSNAKRENRVVSLDLHGTNGYGGYVIKEAACEIHGGKLNEAWTKTHAKRRGWGV